MNTTPTAKDAIGRIPSGLFIVTTRVNEQIEAFIASWVMQISFEPLLIAVAMKDDRPVYQAISQHKAYCINIVDDNHTQILKPFWHGYDSDHPPFDQLDHTISSLGNVILSDCLAAIEMELVDIQKPGDHQLVIGKVQQSQIIKEKNKPKIHLRSSGLSY